MQVKARRAGLRVAEVPVDYRPRIGRSKVSGTVVGHRARGGQDPRHHRCATPSPDEPPARPRRVRGGAVRRASPPGRAPGDQTVDVQRFLATYALAFAAYLAALRVVRRPRDRAGSGRASSSRSPGASPSSPRRRCCPTTSTGTCGRAASSSTAATRTSGRTGPRARGGSRCATTCGAGSPTSSTPRCIRRRGRWPPRAVVWLHDSVTAMKAFLVACEMGALALLARDPAAPRPAAGAHPRPRLEPAGAGGDRGQRAQRRVRDPVDGGGAGRAGDRPPASLRGRGRGRAAGEGPARARGGRVGAALPLVASRRRRGWSPPPWSSRTPTRAPASGTARPATPATGGSTRRCSRPCAG